MPNVCIAIFCLCDNLSLISIEKDTQMKARLKSTGSVDRSLVASSICCY